MAMKFKEFLRNPGNSAFLYCRYSSDAQRELSIDQQIEEAKKYADNHGYNIIKIFEDRGITGTTMERPGLQNMLYEAKLQRPAYLLVWKLDRISREMHDFFAIDGTLLDLGVQTVTVGEPLPEDTGMRYTIQGINAALANKYIIDHRTNVMRGLKYNAAHCLYNGRRILGYRGKQNCPYEIDPATAPLVKRIFQDYADGKPLQTIANELNAAGFKSVKGNSFVVNSLRHMLNNKAYLGIYKWGDYEIKDGLPRLISDQLFEDVSKRLAQNRHPGKRSIKNLNPDTGIADFWLTGHIFCGECNNTIQGTSGTSHTGTTHYYYVCKEKRRHKCSLKNVKKDVIESIVQYTLEEILSNPENRIMYATQCYNYYRSIIVDNHSFEESLKSSIKDVSKRLDNVMSAIEDGIYNETTQARMLDLQKRKSALEDQLKAERLRQKCQIELKDIVRYFEGFSGNLSDRQVRQRVLDIFVDKIIVYCDKIVISMYYDQDKLELPIGETINLIENRKRLIDMVDNHEHRCIVPKELLNSMFAGDDHEKEDSDFF